MTRPTPLVVWVAGGLALISGIVVGPTRSLAAENGCSGLWHFEIRQPTPEQEAWLSPHSLCRSQSLTRTLDLEYKQGDRLPTLLSKSSYRPIEVLFGDSTCEFRLETDDQPVRFGLAFEVPAKGTQVKGKVECSESEAKPDGTRSGMHLDLEVSAKHTDESDLGGEPAHSVGQGEAPERELAMVIEACQKAKAERLWELMTPRFRSEVDMRAAEKVKVLSPADLKRIYQYVGKPRGFTGRILLRQALKLGDATDNPCAGAARWRIIERGPVKDAYVVAIERDRDRNFGLRFLRDGTTWRLDQITQDVVNDIATGETRH